MTLEVARLSGDEFAVLFDAYGTLFDVYSVALVAEQLFPGQGQALSQLWRDKQIEYTRLVTTSEDSVEVAHEALIREWPTLRDWLEENREGLRLHRHITEASHEWELLGRDPGALYRGAHLVQARRPRRATMGVGVGVCPNV